ncbi:hypothetical protein D3C71_1486900 [compost metagenome]
MAQLDGPRRQAQPARRRIPRQVAEFFPGEDKALGRALAQARHLGQLGQAQVAGPGGKGFEHAHGALHRGHIQEILFLGRVVGGDGYGVGQHWFLHFRHVLCLKYFI